MGMDRLRFFPRISIVIPGMAKIHSNSLTETNELNEAKRYVKRECVVNHDELIWYGMITKWERELIDGRSTKKDIKWKHDADDIESYGCNRWCGCFSRWNKAILRLFGWFACITKMWGKMNVGLDDFQEYQYDIISNRTGKNLPYGSDYD